MDLRFAGQMNANSDVAQWRWVGEMRSVGLQLRGGAQRGLTGISSVSDRAPSDGKGAGWPPFVRLTALPRARTADEAFPSRCRDVGDIEGKSNRDVDLAARGWQKSILVDTYTYGAGRWLLFVRIYQQTGKLNGGTWDRMERTTRRRLLQYTSQTIGAWMVYWGVFQDFSGKQNIREVEATRWNCGELGHPLAAGGGSRVNSAKYKKKAIGRALSKHV
jgi:hypothetical protein